MGQPLIIQWMAAIITPENAHQYRMIANNQATPLLMAGWVGLLVTGINMMPLGQLDGGHVTFGLLGERSIVVARAAFLAALLYDLQPSHGLRADDGTCLDHGLTTSAVER